MTGGFFKGPRDFDPAALKAGLAAMTTPRDRTKKLLRHTLLDQQLDAIKAVVRNHEAEREGTKTIVALVHMLGTWTAMV